VRVVRPVKAGLFSLPRSPQPLDNLERLCYNPNWDLVICHLAQVVVSHFLFNYLPYA